MFLARDVTIRWRHGASVALASISAASMAKGPVGVNSLDGEIPSTRASMNRPVANGTAIPATVCATKSGE